MARPPQNKKPGPSLPDLLNMSQLGKIKLGQGVVGKTTYATVAALLALGAIGWAISAPAPQLAFTLGVFIFVVLIAFLAAIIWYAHNNPGPALLEGAELIQYRQLEMAAKDRPAELPPTNVPPPPATQPE
jgi:hypothetical protein